MPVTGQPLSFRVDNELFHAVDVPTAAAAPPGGGPRPRFTRSSLMRLGVARVRQSHRRAEEIAEAEAQARAILQPTSRSVSRRSASEDPSAVRGRSREASQQRRASPPKSRPLRPVTTPAAAQPAAETPPRAPLQETPPRSQRRSPTVSVERAASSSVSPERGTTASTAQPDAITRQPAPQPSETARSANGTSVTGWSAATPPRGVAFGHAVEPASLPIHAPQPPGPTGVSLRAADAAPQSGTPAGRRPTSGSFGHAPSPGAYSVAPAAASNFYDDDVAHSIQRHARPAGPDVTAAAVEAAEVPDTHPQLEAIFSAPFIAGVMVGVIAALHFFGRTIPLQQATASQR